MSPPEVSALIATRDRSRLLEVALRCFRAQRGVRAEAIVVDDSAVPASIPADPAVRLMRVPCGTPLGVKLNLAAELATGSFLAKWDDDDYYGPSYLARMLAHARTSDALVVFAQPFFFYDLLSGVLRVTDPNRCSGATLTMPRTTWERIRFRPVREAVDAEFLLDVIESADPKACSGFDLAGEFVQLRHTRHLWTHMPDGRTVRQYLEGCQRSDATLSDIVPKPVLDRWELLRGQIVAAGR